MKVFVTATGTGVGKTWLTTQLTRALVSRGRHVAALKPIETGCDPDAHDALALATAAGRLELADAPGFHRGRLPRAPYAATLAGDPPPPALEHLVDACTRAAEGADDVLVEGAGGLLVPYDANLDLADLAKALRFPILVVAPNVLGTLSHVRTAIESARARGLRVAAIALNEVAPDADPAAEHHERILQERSAIPVIRVPHAAGINDPSIRELLRILGT